MKFNFISPAPQGGGSGKQLVTVNNFFQTEENVGYIKPETFKQLIEQLKEEAPRLLSIYSEFFNCVRQDYTIRNAVVKRKHLTSGSDYYFLKMRKGKVLVELTVYLVENLEKFVLDYANSRISTDFNWNELVEFSKNH